MSYTKTTELISAQRKLSDFEWANIEKQVLLKVNDQGYSPTGLVTPTFILPPTLDKLGICDKGEEFWQPWD